MKNYIPVIALSIIFCLSNACNSDDETAVDFINQNAELCEGKDVSFTKEKGSLACTMTSGVPPYTFLWSSGETTESIVPVVSGMHSCTISDAEGCQAGYSIMIELPEEDPCELGLVINEDLPGQLAVTPINATGDITYLWSTDEDTSSIEVDHNGRYRVMITDESGCTAKEEILVNLPGPCNGFIASTDDKLTNTFPIDILTNMIDLTSIIDIEGGTPPYLVENLFDCFPDKIPSYLDVRITDAQGCVFTMGVPSSNSICEEIPITITHTLGTDVFTFSTSSSDTPFSEVWSVDGSGSSVEVMDPGIISLVIENEDGCISVATFELIE